MTSSLVGDRWVGHPLLTALSMQRQLSACIRFQMWDPVAAKFVDLPLGTSVLLRDDSVNPAHTLATAQIDSQGLAKFNVAPLVPDHPSLYFLAVLANIPIPFAGHAALPQYWSTRGWLARDGVTPGYSKTFTGSELGTTADPIEFEIGVRFHLNIRFQEKPGLAVPPDSGFATILPHTPVELVRVRGSIETSINASVAGTGICQAFSFDLEPGDSIGLKITASNNSGPNDFPYLETVVITDAALPDDTAPALDFTIKPAKTQILNLESTSIGDPALANAFVVKLPEASNRKLCAALRCLKSLAEINSLIHHTAPTDWDHYQGHHISINFINGALSWPIDVVNLEASTALNDRDTQFHEYSHQLLWHFAGIPTAAIVDFYLSPLGHMDHSRGQIFNPQQALLEGWAEIFQYLSTYNEMKLIIGNKSAELHHRYSLSGQFYYINIVNEEGEIIGPHLLTSPNWGELCEGVFAAGLFTVIRDYVLQGWSSFPPAALIPPAPASDITRHAHLGWLNSNAPLAPAIQQRFRNAIIEPAKGLFPIGPIRTTDFIDELRKATGSTWPAVRAILQSFKMGFPEILGVDSVAADSLTKTTDMFGRQVQPTIVPVTGGRRRIFGRHFEAGQLSIANQVTLYVPVSPSIIECDIPPNSLGTIVDISWSSPDGASTLLGAIVHG